MLITRRAEFSASHLCVVPGWSDPENRRVYGEAANPHGHGHNYVVEVTIAGEPDAVTGMIVDLKLVKSILEREVVEPMDHRFLNYEVKPFDTVVPTVENIALEIWTRLARHFDGAQGKLHRVRLFETDDLFVDVTADDLGEGARQ